MNKIERKKLIIIIASIVTAIFAALVITLSVLTGGGEGKTPAEITPTAQPKPTQTANPTDGTSETVPIKGADEEGAPPADAYTNDYSEDVGYVKLPDGYDSSVPAGTVYDEAWMVTRGSLLLCELSTKQTISKQAITPLSNFKDDLISVSNENANNMSKTISPYLAFYNDHMGDRTPGYLRSELNIYCDLGTPED